MTSSSLDEEMLRRIEVMEAELNAGGNAGMQDFRYALRKFCNHCEIFSMHIFWLR